MLSSKQCQLESDSGPDPEWGSSEKHKMTGLELPLEPILQLMEGPSVKGPSSGRSWADPGPLLHPLFILL